MVKALTQSRRNVIIFVCTQMGAFLNTYKYRPYGFVQLVLHFQRIQFGEVRSSQARGPPKKKTVHLFHRILCPLYSCINTRMSQASTSTPANARLALKRRTVKFEHNYVVMYLGWGVKGSLFGQLSWLPFYTFKFCRHSP